MSRPPVMLKRALMAGLLLLAGSAAAGEEPSAVVVPIPNSGFEQGNRGWAVPQGEGISSVTSERAATGRYSLKVKDTDGKRGSSVASELVPVEAGRAFELRGKIYPVSGSGLGMYVRIFGADRKKINGGDDHLRGLGGSDRRWKTFALPVYAPRGATHAQVWIHSYNSARVEAYLDDLELVMLPKGGMPPPWTPQYKIRPGDRDRLTPADVVGPDGVVYPNWQYTGVQGGIPKVRTVARIEDFGARADDELDDSEALQRAVDAIGRGGGGALELGRGTYHLDRPVTVTHDDVVIRGEGADRQVGPRTPTVRFSGTRARPVRQAGPLEAGLVTRLVFRYAIHERGVDFYWPPPGSRVGPGTLIELHASPKGLQKMTIKVDDRTLGTWARGRHAGNTFYYARRGRDIFGLLEAASPTAAARSSGAVGPNGGRTDSSTAEIGGAGRTAEPLVTTLTGVAEYKGGDVRQHSILIVLDRSFKDDRFVPYSRAAIRFQGRGRTGPKLKLARDGERGATRLELESAAGLAVGDCVMIDGPPTARWKKLTKNVCRWGMYRRYETLVDRVEGDTVWIRQPLRIEFPTVDGSFVQKVVPIRRCGIEDLYIEQTENLWITTVEFRDAWNSWARGVTVRMCGRNPVYGSQAKWCEIRDCVFDDAHFKGGGGTAYAGWENSWDCLAENIETFRLRHAPLFQWSASGNVIRKSVFHDSDGQWHAGWTNENLFEQCVITSTRGNGGYGYGLWASPPEDAAHGPNGPRNVVYNCDVTSEKAGLWMGGMNENWLILYNRFVVEKGRGVFAKTTSFDHIIKGNVFVLKDGRSPMVFLASPECTGVEVVQNLLFGGGGRFTGGAGEAELVEGNRAFPLRDAPRPAPGVPSIYEWQQRQKR